MGKTLLESLTVKQLALFSLTLLVAMALFFVVGGIKGADPAAANIHIMNVFHKPEKSKYDFADDKSWVWYQPKLSPKQNVDNGYHEKLTDFFDPDHSEKKVNDASELILSTKFPHPGGVMHNANQFMLIIMTVQMDFIMKHSEPIPIFSRKHECTMQFNAKLGYSDEDEPTNWKILNRVDEQKRPLTCYFNRWDKHEVNEKQGDKKVTHDDGYYTCDDQHLLELGSVAHKHYIINIQLPGGGSNKHCLATSDSAFLSSLHLTEIHQNGGYTISLFVAKTVMFPFVLAALLFFVLRIKREQREKVLLEKAGIFLGISSCILLVPVDWLTFVMDMPFMLLVSDLRQGIFYCALLIFWCIFAGEHILDQQERNKLASYKYEVGCILTSCLALFIFDCIERGIQLSNPFHTIWKKDSGETAARVFIGIAATAAVIYCLFFMRLLYYVYTNVRMKEVALPAMQEDRRLYYENRIYRFRVLLWVTLLIVISTVVCFVLDQVNETSWKFEEDWFDDYVVVSSSMHFGMFGMWGTYVFGILILYSPSGKAAGPDVQYRRSEHLLHAEDTSVDDEDAVQFRHPKT